MKSCLDFTKKLIRLQASAASATPVAVQGLFLMIFARRAMPENLKNTTDNFPGSAHTHPPKNLSLGNKTGHAERDSVVNQRGDLSGKVSEDSGI
jgi:hypothetical protein